MPKSATEIATKLDAQGISIWDATNPRALINLLPERVAEAIIEHYKRDPDLFTKAENPLKKYLRSIYTTVSPTDNVLREKFWIEYDTCHAEQAPKMVMTRIFGRVITEGVFWEMVNSPTRMAWLICPPTHYIAVCNEALTFGISELRDILEKPHENDHGMVNLNFARLKLNIVQMLDARIHGAATQRIITKNEHKIIGSAVESNNDERLIERLKQITKMEREAQHIPDVEVKPVQVTDLSMAEKK